MPQAAAAAEEELLLLHDYEHYVRSRGIAPADPAAVVRAGEAELAERSARPWLDRALRALCRNRP